MAIKLSQSKFGRMILHLICLILQGHVSWHVAGIVREIKSCESYFDSVDFQKWKDMAHENLNCPK